jgi:hypothetical protein
VAVPSYTTDLTTLNTAEATTNWTEPTGATAGGIAVAETDFFIQGTGCISKTFNATGLGGLHYNNGAGVTIPTDGAFMAWTYFAAPNAINTEANGGMRLTIGSGTGDYKAWYVRGSDTYAYGGWNCIPVDPTFTADATQGTPGATLQYFGMVINGVNAVAKGNPFGIDAIRYGRCEMRINGGETANYAIFSGAAAQNDTNTNRWGLVQATPGGYLWQGLMTLGYTSLVDFRDSNTTVLVANTKRVSANFNKIEVRQATSRVDWTNIAFIALGTQSRGRFECIDDADVNILGCTFTDLDTFVFKSNSTITDSTFRRTGQITQGNSVITGTLIDNNRAASAILSDNPADLSYNTFISDGTGHAIEITTPGTYTFAGNIFSGYAGTNGSTGNEAIYNNSGGAVTLNVTSGGGTPTIRNGTGASTTVNSNVAITITGLVDNTEVRVYGAGTTTPELAGTDAATDGTSGNRSFTFSVASGTSLDIRIHAISYEHEDILAFSTTADTSIPVKQRFDRNYENN